MTMPITRAKLVAVALTAVVGAGGGLFLGTESASAQCLCIGGPGPKVGPVPPPPPVRSGQMARLQREKPASETGSAVTKDTDTATSSRKQGPDCKDAQHGNGQYAC